MWHDVKLYPTEGSRAHNVVNMVNEIPRCSRKKYEIATNEGDYQLLVYVIFAKLFRQSF
jgi:inorganic pyrophosphatase